MSTSTIINTGEFVANVTEDFCCTDCGKCFIQAETLLVHVKYHTGDLPHTCVHCGSKFAVINHLLNHESVHNKVGEILSHECEVCHKCFIDAGTLKAHNKEHFLANPFKCIMCEARFVLASGLKNHAVSHLNDKCLVCSICKATFSCGREILACHLKTHHPISAVLDVKNETSSYKFGAECGRVKYICDVSGIHCDSPESLENQLQTNSNDGNDLKADLLHQDKQPHETISQNMHVHSDNNNPECFSSVPVASAVKIELGINDMTNIVVPENQRSVVPETIQKSAIFQSFHDAPTYAVGHGNTDEHSKDPITNLNSTKHNFEQIFWKQEDKSGIGSIILSCVKTGEVIDENIAENETENVFDETDTISAVRHKDNSIFEEPSVKSLRGRNKGKLEKAMYKTRLCKTTKKVSNALDKTYQDRLTQVSMTPVEKVLNEYECIRCSQCFHIIESQNFCTECGQSFDFFDDLQSHTLNVHHQTKLVSCPVCNKSQDHNINSSEKTFQNARKYQLGNVLDIKVVLCDIKKSKCRHKCMEKSQTVNYESNKRRDYLRHISGSISNTHGKFKCRECKVYFPNVEELNLHRDTHCAAVEANSDSMFSRNVYMCNMCGKKYDTRNKTASHLRVDHKSKTTKKLITIVQGEKIDNQFKSHLLESRSVNYVEDDYKLKANETKPDLQNTKNVEWGNVVYMSDLLGAGIKVEVSHENITSDLFSNFPSNKHNIGNTNCPEQFHDSKANKTIECFQISTAVAASVESSKELGYSKSDNEFLDLKDHDSFDNGNVLYPTVNAVKTNNPSLFENADLDNIDPSQLNFVDHVIQLDKALNNASSSSENPACFENVAVKTEDFKFPKQLPSAENKNTSLVEDNVKTVARKQGNNPDNVCDQNRLCTDCNTSFPSEYALKLHTRIHILQKKKNCEECNNYFTNRQDYQNHMYKVHSITKGYSCEVCEKSFTSLSCLATHIRLHTGEKPYKCELCSNKFHNKRTFQMHSLLHSKKYLWVCKICDAKFRHPNSVRRHLKTNHKKRSSMDLMRCVEKGSEVSVKKTRILSVVHGSSNISQCQKCAKVFESKQKLECHMTIHKIEEKRSCSHCHETFKYFTELQKHMFAKHKSARSFKCEICDSMFKEFSALKVHMRNHTGEKPYKCQYCKESFVAASGLRNHTYKHKQNPSCNLCGEKFTSLTYMYHHMNKVHDMNASKDIVLEDTRPESVNTTVKIETIPDSSPSDTMAIVKGDEKPRCAESDHKFQDLEDDCSFNENNSHSYSGGSDSYSFTPKKSKSFESNNTSEYLNNEDSHKEVVPCTKCAKTFPSEAKLQFHMTIHTIEEQTSCNECGEKFNHFTKLKNHMLTKHKSASFRCKICDCLFKRFNALKVHIRKHTGEKPYKCKHCDASFAFATSYKCHAFKHKENACCKLCGESFTSYRRGYYHMKRVHQMKYSEDLIIGDTRTPHKNMKAKSLSCGKCEEIYSDIISLDKHKKVCSHMSSNETQLGNIMEDEECVLTVQKTPNCHKRVPTSTSLKSFQCRICDDTFSSYEKLKIHVTLHEKIDNLLCKKCNVKFDVMTYYEKHMRTKHNNMKPYDCDICNGNFSCFSALKRHIRLHTGEKPYRCLVCGKRFVSISSLNIHAFSHTQGHIYICKVCGNQYSTKSGVFRHLKLEHKVKWTKNMWKKSMTGSEPNEGKSDLNSATNCGNDRSYIKRSAGNNLMNETSDDQTEHTCTICGFSTSTNKKLELHLKRHKHTTPIITECKMCGESFNSLSAYMKHMTKQHQVSKAFTCEICLKGFGSLNSLRNHRTFHTGEKPYSCKVCNRRFPFLSGLRKHSYLHDVKGFCACKKCGKKFKSVGKVLFHLRKHHKVKSVKNLYSIEDGENGTETTVSLETTTHKAKPQFDNGRSSNSFVVCSD